jgi:phosphoribosylaminoimidazole carboxylase / phosphoribosylaminoimidazole-succinocarboxamide synthase
MNHFSFSPPRQETFFKDDANDDPQWSEDQIISANFKVNGLLIGKIGITKKVE